MPLDELLAIMRHVEAAMLAVPPCDNNIDAYFAAAVIPHREVLNPILPRTFI